MATRFAGDFFGISLVDPEEEKGSTLLDYYPELRSLPKKAAVTDSADGETEGKAKDTSARLYGGAQAAPVFSGFKTFEKTGGRQAAPLFTGFKTFEQTR